MFRSARFFGDETVVIRTMEAEWAAGAADSQDAAERHGPANRAENGAAAKPRKGWRRWFGRH
jgi:hypothetical protein